MKYALPLCMLLALAGCDKTTPDTPQEAQARQTCKSTIEARATKPESVAYPGDPLPVGHSKPNGQLDVTIHVSAKNEIGMASPLVANCVVSADGKTLVDIQVKNKR